MAQPIRSGDNSGSASDRSGFDEKRSGKDRRTHRFPKLRYLLFAGRRAHVRREEDWHGTFYFDRYSSNIFAAIVLILLLSVLDALLSLPVAEPGTHVVYSCPGFILLGWMLERITSRPLDEMFRERVLPQSTSEAMQSASWDSLCPQVSL